MTRARALGGILVLLLFAAWFLTREPESGPGPSQPAPAQESPVGPGPTSGARRTGDEGPERNGTVVGRVVDLLGEPWVALTISGGGRETRTGSDGAFELGGLELAPLALDLSADFDPALPLGERQLACAVPAVPVDLAAGEERVDLGTRIVPRSRPFWIEGALELDEDWARSKAVTLAEARLEFVLPQPEELGSLLQPALEPPADGTVDWNRPPWRAELPGAPPLSPEGRFRVGVETPHDPFLLRIWLRRFEPIERLIVPRPGGRFAETFRMP